MNGLWYANWCLFNDALNTFSSNGYWQLTHADSIPRLNDDILTHFSFRKYFHDPTTYTDWLAPSWSQFDPHIRWTKQPILQIKQISYIHLSPVNLNNNNGHDKNTYEGNSLFNDALNTFYVTVTWYWKYGKGLLTWQEQTCCASS